jgi:hypothetical protein
LNDGLGFFLRLCRPHQSLEILAGNTAQLRLPDDIHDGRAAVHGSSFYSADPTWAMPLTLALLAGTMGPKGPNRFGSDPLAKGNMSVNAFEARHA